MYAFLKISFPFLCILQKMEETKEHKKHSTHSSSQKHTQFPHEQGGKLGFMSICFDFLSSVEEYNHELVD